MNEHKCDICIDSGMVSFSCSANSLMEFTKQGKVKFQTIDGVWMPEPEYVAMKSKADKWDTHSNSEYEHCGSCGISWIAGCAKGYGGEV